MNSKMIFQKVPLCTFHSGNSCFHMMMQDFPGFLFSFKLHTDGKEEFLYASENAIDIYGLDAKTIQEDIETLRCAFHVEDLKMFKKLIRKSARTLEPFYAEFRYAHPKKGLVWLETRSRPMPQEDGSVIWQGITHDVTERKTLEIELRDSLEFIQSVVEAMPDMLFEFDKEGRYLNVWAQKNHPLLASKKSMLGKKMEEVLPPEASEVAKQTIEAADKQGYSIGNTYALDIDGVKRWFEFSMTKKDLSNTYLALSREITEQIKSRRTIDLLYYSLNFSIESIYWIDLETFRFMQVNDTAVKTLGYSKEEFLGGMGVYDIDPDHDVSALRTHLEELKQCKKMTFETRHKTKNGVIFPVEIRSSYFEYDTKPYILSLATDITKRKNTEMALLKTTTHLRAILNTIPDMIWMKDIEGVYLGCNHAFEIFFDAPEKEIVGKRDYDFVDKTLADFFRQKDLEAISQGDVCTNEEEVMYKKTGERGILETRKAPVFCSNGRFLGVLGIAKDITRKKTLELELQQKEMRLKEAHRIAKLGSWELLFPELQFHLSEELYGILHLDKTENILSFDHFLNIIHPEDRERFDALVHDAIKERKAYDTVHRILVRDGGSKYIYEHAEAVYDMEGKPVKMIGIMQDITELKQAEHTIEFLSYHDTLTGLPNRSLAINRLEQAIGYAKKHNTKVALLHMDIDGFKTINDSFGYHTGDGVIQAFARRLKENLKETDTVSRQGGDEFLMIITDISDTDDLSTLISHLMKKLNEPIDVHTHSFVATLSLGIAIAPEDGQDFETLLQKADTALRKAKESGGNTYCFFTEEMNQEIFENLHIQNDLKRALMQEQFVLHYQPQIDLKTNTIHGVEALLRWKHPEKGLIPPMKFIPIAESSGLIVEIGAWVIHEACHQASKWHKKGINITIAVNISAVQFKRGNLEHVIEEALKKSGLNPHYLELELTESLLIQDTENVFSAIKRLKNLGVKLSIDDFGTGYSSLSYLKRFAVDKLKIDRSFVRDILKDPEDNAIVQAIIQMAKSLNLKTIAEGVEDKEVVELVRQYGCDEIQGFYFAKPMPHDELIAYCKKMLF